MCSFSLPELISCQSVGNSLSAFAHCVTIACDFRFGPSDTSTVQSCQKTKSIIKNSFSKKVKQYEDLGMPDETETPFSFPARPWYRMA